MSENSFRIKVSHSLSQTCQANVSGHNEAQLGDILGVAGAIQSPEYLSWRKIVGDVGTREKKSGGGERKFSQLVNAC